MGFRTFVRKVFCLPIPLPPSPPTPPPIVCVPDTESLRISPEIRDIIAFGLLKYSPEQHIEAVRQFDPSRPQSPQHQSAFKTNTLWIANMSQKPPQRVEASDPGSNPATFIFLHGFGDDADGWTSETFLGYAFPFPLPFPCTRFLSLIIRSNYKECQVGIE